MEKKVVELFAGVGGFRCGLNDVKLIKNEVHENNTWEFVWANQWEPSTKSQPAFDCYNERFGESENHINEDIGTIDKNTIPNHTLLVGGFPCQDYSVARSLSNNHGIEGKKGVLWWEIAEVLEAKNPPFVLLENVDRLLRSPASQRGRDFGIMLRTFLDNDYSVEWRVINAGEYGFPQKRRRVFIFAYKNSTKYYSKMNKISSENVIFNEGIFAKNFPIKDELLDKGKKNITEKEYVDLVDVSDNFDFHFFNSGIMRNGRIYTAKVLPNCSKITPLRDVLEKGDIDDKYILDEESFEKWKFLKGAKKIPRKKPNGECYNYSEGSMAFPDNLDVPARTMLTSETSLNRSSHVVEDFKTKKLRLLTPLEAERINGFPDNWTKIDEKTGMTDKRRFFMMGNALVVGIINKLGKYIETIIENE